MLYDLNRPSILTRTAVPVPPVGNSGRQGQQLSDPAMRNNRVRAKRRRKRGIKPRSCHVLLLLSSAPFEVAAQLSTGVCDSRLNYRDRKKE